MVRPLYPLRPKPPAPPPPAPSALRNPYVVSAIVLVVVLVVTTVFHIRSRRNVVDPQALPGRQQSRSPGIFGSSRHFTSEAVDISEQSKKQLSKLGISTDTQAFSQEIKATDLREQRRLMAIQKYSAIREEAERRERAQEELRQRRSSPASKQLKEAVKALESSDTLGIMRLERLIEDRLVRHGASSQDLDVIIYAYENLANAYIERGMPEKAKEAYVNSFRLMRDQAPSEQSAQWDRAVNTVEQMKTPSGEY